MEPRLHRAERDREPVGNAVEREVGPVVEHHDCPLFARQAVDPSQDVVARGHAIECRVNAEAAHRLFAPSPGTIGRYAEPAGPGVRVDSGAEAGSSVPPFYDSLLAKVAVWDVDRGAATARMLRALGEFEVDGVDTLLPFHRRLLASDEWARGETARNLLADRDWLRATAEGSPEVETRRVGSAGS